MDARADRRRHGAYFTPEKIADFLVRWAVGPSTSRILEPSVGQGEFIRSADRACADLPLAPAFVATDIDPVACDEARGVPATSINVDVIETDFFGYQPTASFDVVVGNPPWIRSTLIPEQTRLRALARCMELGVKLDGSCSLWAPFVVASVSMLHAEGRLAMVLPAELLQVDYAAEVRTFLQHRFKRIVVLRFDEHVFADATVDAILLLASDDGEPGVWIGHLPGLRQLQHYGGWLKRHDQFRWSPTDVEPRAIELLNELVESHRYVSIAKIAEVKIGTVTGNNSFFVLRRSDMARLGIPQDCVAPIITHPWQLSRGSVDNALIDSLDAKDVPLWVLAVDEGQQGLVGSYLSSGEQAGVDQGYKCRKRTPWYSVRIEKAPDLFLAYMSHVLCRCAVNEANVASTNLVHGIYLHDPRDRRDVASRWANAATALSCELEGRSYGGGVLKLEPSEAKRVIVPRPGDGRKLRRSEHALLERSWKARVRSRLARNGSVVPRSLKEAAA
jgi:adenine-specific DNA methylase